MKFRICTIVYGARHYDWFVRGCIASLGWPRNRAALADCTAWDIYTMPDEFERAKEAVAPLGVPAVMHSLVIPGSPQQRLQDCLIRELQIGVKTGEAILLALPDFIFGDGTLEVLKTMGPGAGRCIAVPHVRVNAETFLPGFGGALTNPQLVARAWEHLHQTWTEAEASRPKTNSWRSGVSWRAVGPGLYAITHCLPSPFLVHATPQDIEWFKAEEFGGAWDHRWPAKLVETQRHRVIGGSDAAFIAELTLTAENHPSIKPANPADVDWYQGTLAHHLANRNMVSIWRAAHA